MLKGLRNKIAGITFIIFFGFIIVTVLGANIVFKNILNEYYMNLAKSDNKNLMNNITLYKTLIEESAKQVTFNTNIIDFLKKPISYFNIQDILDGIKLSNTRILGAILFSIDGDCYTSGYVSDYPSFKEILEDKNIASFINDSNQKNKWLVRNKFIPKYYNNNYYRSELGVITYISKIEDQKGKVRGYLFIDIDPKYFYTSNYNDDNKNYRNDINIYIYDKKLGLLPKEYNLGSAKVTFSLYDQRNNLKTFVNNKSTNIEYYYDTLIFVNHLFNNSYLIITFNTNSFKNDLLIYTLLLVSGSILLIFASIFLSFGLAKSIYNPLAELISKMRDYQKQRDEIIL